MADSPILPGQHAWKDGMGRPMPVEFFRFFRDLLLYLRTLQNGSASQGQLDALQAQVDCILGTIFSGPQSVKIQGTFTGGLLDFRLDGDQNAPLPISMYSTNSDGDKGWHLLTPDAIPSPHATYLVDENGNYLRDEKGNLLASDTMASSDDVRMARLPYSTYSTLQESFNVLHSPGLITGGGFENLPGGNLGVSSGTCLIRDADDDVSALNFADFDSAVIPIPLNASTRYIGVERNGGYPQVVVKDSNTWNMDTEFPLGTAVNLDGTVFHFFNPFKVGDPITNIIQRFDAQATIIRSSAGGLILGNTGTRNATLTEGVAWARLNDYQLTAKNSATQSMFSVAPNPLLVPSLVLTPGFTQWPNTQYVNGTTLTLMGNNKWANLWFYVSVDSDEWMFAYGTNEYNNASEAALEGIPAYLSENFLSNSLLVGRFIFEKSNDTPIIESAFSRAFSTQAVSDHNQLSNLQGGQLGEYFHLTSAERTSITGVTGSAAQNLVWATPNGSSGLATFRALVANDLPAHNSLNSLQGGSVSERYHLTLSQYNSVVASITPGTTGQFWRGDLSWSNTLVGPFSIDGNFTVSGGSRRIFSDFSSGGSTRTFFQTSTANGTTNIGVIPNGTGSIGVISAFSSSDPANASGGQFVCNAGAGIVSLNSVNTGTGVLQPIALQFNSSTALRIDPTTRHVTPGTANAQNMGTDTLRWASIVGQNLVLGANATSFGGGSGVAFISNATTVPTSNPVGGGIIYVESGALKYRGSSGTITILGPA